MSNLLKLDEKYFISIICFSNQAKVYVNCYSIVTKLAYLKNNILRFKNKICDIDILELSNTIKSNNIVDRRIRKQHVKNIYTKINYNKELENNMICPRCGNELVERNGKYGKFIGCSNFPKCRYIKK